MSHWYPHTIGTKDGGWYWITHPDLPGTYTRGESNEEDADWDTVAWWSGPFKSWDEACDNMSDAQGNAGSYTGPAEGPEAAVVNELSPKLKAQPTPDKRARRYW